MLGNLSIGLDAGHGMAPLLQVRDKRRQNYAEMAARHPATDKRTFENSLDHGGAF
jgi:hypothetical protein